jgi:hypothetical protein
VDENLIGYLLDALEPAERRKVERYLRANPEAAERLAVLQEALEPLAADSEPIEPPLGLWVRTLGRIADYRNQSLPQAPQIPAGRSGGPGGSWWRRADVAVAASILLCASLLLTPGLGQLRYRANIAACQNNLREVHTALAAYSDRHQGKFPDIASAAPEPRNVAVLFIPMLREDGLLPETTKVSCPAVGGQPTTVLSLRQINQLALDDFNRSVAGMAGCYAYSLGYSDENGIHGIRLIPEMPNISFLPIMADRPPDDIDGGSVVNSPNHGGRGQNVLYVDGRCAFWANRTVGVAGDDIYLNYEMKVKAGKSIWDSVLATGECRP